MNVSFCQRKIGDHVVVEMGEDDSYSSDGFYEEHDTLPRIESRKAPGKKKSLNVSRAGINISVKRTSTVEYVKDNAGEIF